MSGKEGVRLLGPGRGQEENWEVLKGDKTLVVSHLALFILLVSFFII